jgi:hypothetical protein
VPVEPVSQPWSSSAWGRPSAVEYALLSLAEASSVDD